MDETQVGLGVLLLGAAWLLVLGRSQPISEAVLYGLSGLAIALTVGAVAIAAIRNRESHVA
ncbi:hypothetical protein [Halovivax limisalsi]|uniref:hypothetical protein n=1 Tax=Halovivax limisalsi TaxID=1453760 RepID=UPI001FFC45F5|nr:hypothetical protein [Halovivax limisalsi]